MNLGFLLQETHKGLFIGLILSFPAENQQEDCLPKGMSPETKEV